MIFWYAKFVVTEAHLVFGGGHIVIVLQVFVCRLFVLLESGLIRIIFLFGTIWIFFSSAGFVLARLGAASITPMFWFPPRGVISYCLIAIGFFGSIHHIYGI